VLYRINAEGIHYCFKHYSKFLEIEDENFHKLKNEFLKSSQELMEYIQNKIDELTDEI
jgi:DNA-directed RNA polymerase subunit F